MTSSTFDCNPAHAFSTTFDRYEIPQDGESTPEGIRERGSISSSETVGPSLMALLYFVHSLTEAEKSNWEYQGMDQSCKRIFIYAR
jgi:hypothetical protein